MFVDLKFQSQKGLGLVESILAIAGLAIVALGSSTLFMENLWQTKNAELKTNVMEIKQAMESFIWKVAVAHSEYFCSMRAADLDSYISGTKITPEMTMRFATQIPPDEFSTNARRAADMCMSPVIPSLLESKMSYCFIIERDVSEAAVGSMAGKTFLLVVAELDFINLASYDSVECKDISKPSAGGGALIRYTVYWSEKRKSELIERSFTGVLYATN